MAIGYGVAVPKPEPRTRVKARAKREQRDHVTEVRQYVFARERDLCRCCRFRRAESMHELRPKSLRGRVSRSNSIAVCGDGVRGCHGFLQRHEITFHRSLKLGAEATLYFMPCTEAARTWTRLGERHGIESPVMRELEAD